MEEEKSLSLLLAKKSLKVIPPIWYIARSLIQVVGTITQEIGLF